MNMRRFGRCTQMWKKQKDGGERKRYDIGEIVRQEIFAGVYF